MIFRHLRYDKGKKKSERVFEKKNKKTKTKQNKKKQGEPPTRLLFRRFVDIMMKKKRLGERERERESESR